MIKVGKLLKNKSAVVWSIGPEESVYQFIEEMSDKGIGALPVVLDEKLIGIISERDYARKIALLGRTSENTKVKDIMTRHVYHTNLNQNIDECLVLMNDKRIRHMPVLEDGLLIGMISIGDVVKQVIDEQKYTIQQLENNISWEESY